MIEPDRPQMTIWRMRFTCFITKPIDTLCNMYCFSTATMVTRTRRNASFICTNIAGLFFCRRSSTRWRHTRVELKVRMFADSAAFCPEEHFSLYERTATKFSRSHPEGWCTCHSVLSVNAGFSTDIRWCADGATVRQLLAHL
jgi:hypothetical protein